MTPFLLIIGALALFGGGIAIGVSIKTLQIKTGSELKRMLAREREQGRLEGSAGRGSIEPPAPWTD